MVAGVDKKQGWMCKISIGGHHSQRYEGSLMDSFTWYDRPRAYMLINHAICSLHAGVFCRL